MAKNFFADNIEELPNHRIDYGAFRNSASSLRDFYLFGPPPVTQSTNQLFHQGEDLFVTGCEVRKSIYLNEFVGFCYKETNWKIIYFFGILYKTALFQSPGKLRSFCFWIEISKMKRKLPQLSENSEAPMWLFLGVLFSWFFIR